jgi:hypothetical protein
MGLDIRWPIGFMFTLIGVLLAVYGVAFHGGASTKVNGETIPIDIVWGVVLLIFGILMLLGAIRGGKTPPSA